MTRKQSLALATVLLLGIGVLHYGLQLLAVMFADPPAALRALFYVGQGIKGVVLFAVIALFMPRRLYSIPVVLACFWGATEDFLVAGCRLARGIDSPLDLGLWDGVCSSLHAGPSYLIGALMGGVAAASILYELRYGQHHNS